MTKNPQKLVYNHHPLALSRACYDLHVARKNRDRLRLDLRSGQQKRNKSNKSVSILSGFCPHLIHMKLQVLLGQITLDFLIPHLPLTFLQLQS